jgi:hypothetical protein
MLAGALIHALPALRRLIWALIGAIMIDIIICDTHGGRTWDRSS